MNKNHLRKLLKDQIEIKYCKAINAQKDFPQRYHRLFGKKIVQI